MSEEQIDLIRFCYESALYFGVQPEQYEELPLTELNAESEWFEHLWDK